jgi:hypothetical protein
MVDSYQQIGTTYFQLGRPMAVVVEELAPPICFAHAKV